MPEIERKFLVDAPPPLDDGAWTARRLEQGYLAVTDAVEVRVRRADGADARLTVKSAPGLTRVEEELALDGDAFERLWPLTEGRRVVKTRHTRRSDDDGLLFELDVYEGSLRGLTVLEVEFASEHAAASWTPPPWIAREVTGEKAYANQSLALYGAP
ncbi:MAG TPA: CYTH domain-containing protein [Baekduia sp.]|uniref:CYTH domain-containing protein n=1 Tax=Baekduia sp. TaxID=2600305 RepID=UPI002D785EA4|nr:CYTH domain-containing protein [Baekduia sp.]HET6510507.1 CYTH domain-containing protein [Baekduia sp.]